MPEPAIYEVQATAVKLYRNDRHALTRHKVIPVPCIARYVSRFRCGSYFESTSLRYSRLFHSGAGGS